MMVWTPNLRHFENTGCCHPNLRSLQLSLFLSVSNLGSTPGIMSPYSLIFPKAEAT
jgi:hypothetical protein